MSIKWREEAELTDVGVGRAFYLSGKNKGKPCCLIGWVIYMMCSDTNVKQYSLMLDCVSEVLQYPPHNIAIANDHKMAQSQRNQALDLWLERNGYEIVEVDA